MPSALHAIDVQKVGQQAGRTHPCDLEKRFTLWVHRCISINAQAAACCTFRLFAKTNRAGMNSVARKGFDGVSAGLGLTPLSKETKRWLRSTDKVLAPGRYAQKAVAGDLDDMREIESHPILTLLNEANPWQSGYAIRVGIYSDLQLFGRAFVHHEDDQLWRRMPQYMAIVTHPTNFVQGFEYGDGAQKVVYRPDQILWFHLFDPGNPWGGIGPLEAWLTAVDASINMQAYQQDIFNNHGSPDWNLHVPGGLAEGQKRTIRQDWRLRFAKLVGRKDSLSFTQGKDVELKRLSDTPKDLEYGAGEDRKRDQICQAFGVPKAIVTTDDVNRANAVEALVMHARFGYWPMVRDVEDALNEQLVRPIDPNLVLVHDNPIPGDAEDRRAERKSRLESGWTVNETRRDSGEDEVEGGDEPLVAATLTPLNLLLNPPQPTFGLPLGGDGEAPPKPEPQPEKAYAARDLVHIVKALQAGRPADVPGPDQLERQFVRGVARTLAGLRDRVVDRLREAESKAATNGDAPGADRWLPPEELEEWRAVVRSGVGKHLRPSLRRAGREALRQVGATISFDLANTRARDYLDRTERRIGLELTDSWRDVLRKALVAGTEAGEAPRAIANRILDTVNADVTRAWATRIARTEMAFAAVNGTEMGWQQSGVVVGKQYVLAPDACVWCQAVAAEFGNGRGAIGDSRTLKLGEPFFKRGDTLTAEIDGEKQTRIMDYAADDGDPTVPPTHPHCRCSVRPVLEGEA